MQPLTDAGVEKVFNAYPAEVHERMMHLRELVFEVAKEYDKADRLLETLKWGEPSYLAKGGSTVRMDWKPARPESYALYFTCSSGLVDTFRQLYPNKLQFEGNRAILLSMRQDIPRQELKHCISLALRYHELKKLPLLGCEDMLEEKKQAE